MMLNYERSGSGTPVLLLHGLGGYAGLWRPVVERLEGSRDVIAPDLPGFGGSPPLDGSEPATAAELAEPVAALCAELGVERPHVTGNSLGAWVGLEMAKRGQVASVLGISPAGLWRNALGPRSVDSQGLGRRLRPLISVVLRSAGGRERLLRTTMARPELVPPDDARDVVMNYIGAPGYAGGQPGDACGAVRARGEDRRAGNDGVGRGGSARRSAEQDADATRHEVLHDGRAGATPPPGTIRRASPTLILEMSAE